MRVQLQQGHLLCTTCLQEDGVARGVEAFHKHLPIEALRGEKVR